MHWVVPLRNALGGAPEECIGWCPQKSTGSRDRNPFELREMLPKSVIPRGIEAEEALRLLATLRMQLLEYF